MDKKQYNIIEEYIKKVKKELPNWLTIIGKTDDILEELRQNILEEAGEISKNNSLNEDSLKKSIEIMGSPKNIAQEYKNRGTPKYFITEELWPKYTKILKTVVFRFLGYIPFLYFIPPYREILFSDLLYFIICLFVFGIMLAFIVISGIFIYYSKNGYLSKNVSIISDENLEIIDTKISKIIYLFCIAISIILPVSIYPNNKFYQWLGFFGFSIVILALIKLKKTVNRKNLIQIIFSFLEIIDLGYMIFLMILLCLNINIIPLEGGNPIFFVFLLVIYIFLMIIFIIKHFLEILGLKKKSKE